jgi:hypothetical protein
MGEEHGLFDWLHLLDRPLWLGSIQRPVLSSYSFSPLYWLAIAPDMQQEALGPLRRDGIGSGSMQAKKTHGLNRGE